MYSKYYGFCESVVLTSSMSKTPDLDTVNREQLMGSRCMGHWISEIVRKLVFFPFDSVNIYWEYKYVGVKIISKASCKGQLALNERGNRQLSGIVSCQKS